MKTIKRMIIIILTVFLMILILSSKVDAATSINATGKVTIRK